MKRSYLVNDLLKESGRGRVASIAFVPLLEMVWRMADDTLATGQFPGLFDAVFCAQGGHFDRGQWQCRVDGEEVLITPFYTDLSQNFDKSIYMTHRVEVSGMVSGSVEKALSSLNFFFKKHVADKALFQSLHVATTEMLRQHCPDLFESEVRRFYDLS